MEPHIQDAPSMAGPTPLLVGLYHVTTSPGHTSLGTGYLTLDDAHALARWAKNGGYTDICIKPSADFSGTVPLDDNGPAYWPALGRWSVIQDGQIITMDRTRP
jgi:hypothetical protein